MTSPPGDDARIYKVREVFVPGGRPAVTYVPRGERHLEDEIADYLDARHKVLSVSGPTKTGKTVLLKSQIPRRSSTDLAIGRGDLEH